MKNIFILIIIFLFTGCNSYIELNDLKIINAIGIEKNKENYTFYISLVNELEIESDKSTTIKTLTANSIQEMLDKLSLSLSKKIYLAHLDLLVINEDIKSNDLKHLIEFFVNNHETREDFLVVSSKVPKEILTNSKFKEINDLVLINENTTSKAIYTTMYDVINNFYLHDKIYLSNIEYDNSLNLNGFKVLDNNKYETINKNDTLFINYLLNNINTYNYTKSCNNNYLYLNILNSNTINKKDISITNEILIVNNYCNYKNFEIEEIFNNYLKDNISRFTNKKIEIKTTIRGQYENK